MKTIEQKLIESMELTIKLQGELIDSLKKEVGRLSNLMGQISHVPITQGPYVTVIQGPNSIVTEIPVLDTVPSNPLNYPYGWATISGDTVTSLNSTISSDTSPLHSHAI